METNKESSFVQEIESRLNVLFGEDFDKRDAKKDAESKSGQDRLDEVALEPPHTDENKSEHIDSGSEPLYVHESLKEVTIEPPSEPDLFGDKKDTVDDSEPEKVKGSDFIREIEDRLNTIFLKEDKVGQPEVAAPTHADLQKIVPPSDVQSEDKPREERFDAMYGNLDETSSIMYSPLKELKGIVLSIEWEINDTILEKFDQEISHLDELYSEDRTVLGFLRILRFLGRFIRAKEADADAVSIKLLLFIYDDLESVVLSNTLTAEAKHAMLAEDIKKYRTWVATADLALHADDEGEKTGQRPESAINGSLTGQGVSALTGTTSQPSPGDSDTLSKIKDLAPHEIVAYVLDEIKKTIADEIRALRADLKLK
jgi:hypothetical protein